MEEQEFAVSGQNGAGSKGQDIRDGAPDTGEGGREEGERVEEASGGLHFSWGLLIIVAAMVWALAELAKAVCWFF